MAFCLDPNTSMQTFTLSFASLDKLQNASELYSDFCFARLMFSNCQVSIKPICCLNIFLFAVIPNYPKTILSKSCVVNWYPQFLLKWGRKRKHNIGKVSGKKENKER